MNDELQRKISEALDAGGLAADDPLRADPATAAYADDLVALDSALARFGEAPLVGEPDWDAMADSIAARLESAAELDDIGDVTLAPLAEEAPAPARAAAAAERDEAPRVALAAAAPARTDNVVDLASRRRVRWMTVVGGLAAAAAVLLGVGVGVGTLGGAASESAAAPAAEEAPWVAMADEEGEWDMPAEEAAPAPTVAAVGTLARGEAWGGAEAEPEAAAEASEAEAPADFALGQRAARRSRARATGSSPSGPYRPSPAPRAASPSSDSLGLSGARGGGGSMAGAPATTATTAPTNGPTPGEPTSAEVQRAFATVSAPVQRCLGERREVVRVRVEVNGPTGRVRTVRVESPHGAGDEGRCITLAVRRAQLPRASSATYEVGHAFRPAPIAGQAARPGTSLRSRSLQVAERR